MPLNPPVTLEPGIERGCRREQGEHLGSADTTWMGQHMFNAGGLRWWGSEANRDRRALRMHTLQPAHAALTLLLLWPPPLLSPSLPLPLPPLPPCAPSTPRRSRSQRLMSATAAVIMPAMLPPLPFSTSICLWSAQGCCSQCRGRDGPPKRAGRKMRQGHGRCCQPAEGSRAAGMQLQPAKLAAARGRPAHIAVAHPGAVKCGAAAATFGTGMCGQRVVYMLQAEELRQRSAVHQY